MAAAQLSLGHTTSLRRATAATAVYLALYTAWQLGGFGGANLRVTVSDLAFVPITLFAAAACVGASRQAHATRRVWAWRLLALALLTYAAGEISQTYYEWNGGTMPYPGLDDALYLAFYPLFFAGVVFLPVAPPRGARLQMMLDGLIVAAGGGSVLWYLVLGPTVAASGTGALFPALVTAAYPCGDLALIVALTYLLLSGRSRLPLGLLTAGVGVFIVSDIAYAYLQNHDAYVGGSLLDYGWLGAMGLFALAAVAGARESREADEPSVAPVGLAVVSSLSVFVVLALVLVTQRGNPFFPDVSVAWLAVAMAVLLGVRQFHARSLLSAANSELHVLRAELERLAVTDAHTGLPNYRAACAALESDVERAARYGRPLSLLFVDLDHFKQVNDTRGHEAGDAVLRGIATLAPLSLRATDLFGRWGGEEFVAILPETDAAAAIVIAERLRRSVAEHRFDDPAGLRVTASIGVASFPADALSKEELVAAADGAMYAAKAAGRDRVVYAGTALRDRDGSARTTRLRPPALAS